MPNYLLPALNAYFGEIMPIQGRLHVSCSFIASFKEKLQTENKQNRELVSSITTYRDLSALKAQENLFTPNFSYVLDVHHLDEEVSIISSQHCGSAIERAYEVFESYLLNILTEYFFQNQGMLFSLGLIDAKLILPMEEIKRILKKNKVQGTNNKGWLSLLRKIAPFFGQVEANNIYKENICQWFDLFSMVRHTLVHNRQVISHRLLDYLNKQKANDLFDRQFKRCMVGTDVHIYLEVNASLDIMTWLSAFAHLIFTSLSKELGLSTRVPQYATRPWR